MATVVGISPEEVLAIAENLKSHCETMLHADTVIHQNAQELAGFNYRAAVTATLLGKYETETNPKFVPSWSGHGTPLRALSPPAKLRCRTRTLVRAKSPSTDTGPPEKRNNYG